MYFIDEVTGVETSCPHPRRVLVSILDNGYRVFGYTHPDTSVIRVQEPSGEFVEIIEDGVFSREELIYSNKRGCYMLKKTLNRRQILEEILTKGRGSWPYSFDRHYEAIESFNIFKNRQKVVDEKKKYPLADYMKYTFGLEFETSEGYIPEHVCFRDGLVPLRDGSISGLEYSTVVLSGEKGLALLDQQLHTLRNYTDFDKECSLHIHFGNFPVNTTSIFNLYKLCKAIEGELRNYVPEYTFHSAQYKSNGKDYCKFLPGRHDNCEPFRTFEEMYESFVGRRYTGSLSEPHPSDPQRNRKWQITTRYFWINFINILCYDVNKTIEFRLLRPSYNLEKIMLWMYLFNAILRYAEQATKNENFNGVCLDMILRRTYSQETYEMISDELLKLNLLIRKQRKYNDKIGATIHFEDSMFDVNKSI